MERRSTAWISAAYALCFAAALWLALRPITPAEARLWDDLVRPPFRIAYFSPSSWSNWLYAVFAKRAAGLFRLSELTLRLPALLAGAAYLYCLSKRPLWILAAVAPVALGIFSTASGVALALALCAAAIRFDRPAPLLLGAAIAAAPVVVIPVVAYATWKGVERIAIPAIVTAFILLILPLSHAELRPAPTIGSREVDSTRAVLLPWRGRPADIAAPPEYQPLVRFYKDRFRERGWTVRESLDATRPGVVVFSH